MKIALRPLRFPLRSLYVVQVCTASDWFYIDVVGTWSSVTGVLRSSLLPWVISPLLISTHQQQTAFENIVGKEEIVRNKQFLLFPQCFLQSETFIPICQYL